VCLAVNRGRESPGDHAIQARAIDRVRFADPAAYFDSYCFGASSKMIAAEPASFLSCFAMVICSGVPTVQAIDRRKFVVFSAQQVHRWGQ
jgi:hypothetical protein